MSAHPELDAEMAPVRAWANREKARLRAGHVSLAERVAAYSLIENATSLETWARGVVANAARHSPLEVAAAYEVAAIACALAGEPELARQARASAAAALTARKSA